MLDHPVGIDAEAGLAVGFLLEMREVRTDRRPYYVDLVTIRELAKLTGPSTP